MYIRELRVRNYMVHEDTRLVLSPLTVLVGPNGAGKSAFFDSMLNFSMLSRGSLAQAFGPYPYSFQATKYHGASPVSRIGFEAVLSENPSDEEALRYEISYSQTGTGKEAPTFTIFREVLRKLPEDEVIFDRSEPERFGWTQSLPLQADATVLAAVRRQHFSGSDLSQVDPLVRYCAQHISRLSKFRLSPTVLAQPSRLPPTTADDGGSVPPPRLGYDGEDLAAVLYYLNETGSATLDMIREAMSNLEPAFSDFTFSTVGADRIAFAVSFSDSRASVPSVRLSAGTLAYLGLIVLVSPPAASPVLLIEEPENGLTPHAVASFYEALKRLTSEGVPEGRSQVLVSSHSPFVICEAWNGEDREFIHQVKVSNGRAQIRSFPSLVDEHQLHLAKDAKGERSQLSLNLAKELMSGYLG